MAAKVSIVKCNSYNQPEVEQAMARALDLIGGISAFIKKGEKVLIKPNILSRRPPEDGVNTHVEVIRAIVRLIKNSGAFPLIGDNPGGSISAKEAYEFSGVLTMSREEGAELIETKNVNMIKGLPISGYFFECDKIISLPKMKTHSLMTITGAIKNMFGAISGLNKSECHKRFPMPDEFVNVLLDVFGAVRPHLAIMDAIVAMEGDGPASGNLRNTGLIIAGEDGVSVDSVFLHLIGVNPFDILTVREAHKRGLGEADLNNIQILGEKIEDSLIDEFKLPHSKIILRLPDFFVKNLAQFVRFWPFINEGMCKKCRICEKTCPVKAISINDDKSLIDYKKCIRCMCCHEVCPYRVIELKRNILARTFGL